MTLVVDASLVVAGLVDSGPDGDWAEGVLGSDDLAAPHLLLAEVANILRRASLHAEISPETASLAHADLLALNVELFPYAPFANRVWELRRNVTAYDAWYVALAETLEAGLATLDAKLVSAAGPRCEFVTPDG
ncbi:MAG: type II toxin-antitoxin system VapC family toxin [Longimicrobiales bacterium]